MKLLEFVTCCRSPAAKSRPETSYRPATSEETRSLVRSPRIRRRRKRGRLGGSPSGHSAEWKPSLCSISEDNVVIEKSDPRVEAERLVKRKSAPRSPRANSGSYGEDYGRSSFPTVIPAFSPTPFMF